MFDYVTRSKSVGTATHAALDLAETHDGFFVGCGTDLSSMKNYEKRLLCSESAKAEREQWECLITQTNGSEACGVFERPRYMCRKCFLGFKRLEQLQCELIANVRAAIAKVTAVPSRLLPRRIHSTGGSSPPAKRRCLSGDIASENVVTSPDVLVNVPLVKIIL